MSAQELAALPPLKPCDGTMLKIWKDDTPLRATLLKLSDITPALLRCEKALGDMSVGMYWYCETWAVWIQFNCNSEEEARKVTGKFWREFGKPKIEKPSDDKMEAHWLVDGLTIKVCGYKPKTCRYEEVQVLVPAKEREVKTTIIEATPEHYETKRVIVCDEKEDEPQVEAEVIDAGPAATVCAGDVPF